MVAGVGGVHIALASSAIERTPLNCPFSAPVWPQDLRNFPSLSNLAIRLLVPIPSAMKILPARSHATSVGLLNAEPCAPAPAPRPPPNACAAAAGAAAPAAPLPPPPRAA